MPNLMPMSIVMVGAFGILLFAVTTPPICLAEITCKNYVGKTVDWFVMYKLPKLRYSSDPLTLEGLGYYYLDVNSQDWTQGKESLNKSNQALYYTLQQAYDNPDSKDQMHIFYNDETPEKHVSESHGHTKGDLNFDVKSGYWLVHSLPRFPPYPKDGYSYPKSGEDFGQTFLCVTYPTLELETIAQQLLYTYPQIYSYNLPDQFDTLAPSLNKVIHRPPVSHTEPQNKSVTLKSVGGQALTSFAKLTYFGADLYDNWVAPALGSSLYVESWQNGPHRIKMPTNCSTEFYVYNIRNLTVGDTNFKETRDHSKWAVTADDATKIICIGDINRQTSQDRRAGGTVCLHDLPNVWKAFRGSVIEFEPCPANDDLEVLQVNLEKCLDDGCLSAEDFSNGTTGMFSLALILLMTLCFFSGILLSLTK